jgi:hypothetical protein
MLTPPAKLRGADDLGADAATAGRLNNEHHISVATTSAWVSEFVIRRLCGHRKQEA